MEAPAAENRSMASILSETGRICRDFHRLFTGNVVLVVFTKPMEVNVMKRQTQKKTEYSHCGRAIADSPSKGGERASHEPKTRLLSPKPVL